MNAIAVLAVIVVLVALIGLIVAVGAHNRVVRVKNLVEESWRQVDVELVRRHDLVPNLVEVVKGYAAHERAVLEAVVEARTKAEAPSTSVDEQGADEARLTSDLTRLLALREAYPDLKADQQFLTLQHQLTETEDRIAAARRFYNGNVRALSNLVDTFPSGWFAQRAGIGHAAYFLTDEADVRAAPAVDLSR